MTLAFIMQSTGNAHMQNTECNCMCVVFSMQTSSACFVERERLLVFI